MRKGPIQAPRPGDLAFTKHHVCRYEIEAAIDVFLRFENLVAAHLLIFSAQEIMSGIAKKTFPPKFNYRTHRIGLFPDKTLKAAWDLHYNFFKHGSRDSDSAVYLNPKLTEIVIFTAILDWVTLFGESTNKMLAYATFFGVNNPEMGLDDEKIVEAAVEKARELGGPTDARPLGIWMLDSVEEDPDLFDRPRLADHGNWSSGPIG